jgi:hypothetical protein
MSNPGSFDMSADMPPCRVMMNASAAIDQPHQDVE